MAHEAVPPVSRTGSIRKTCSLGFFFCGVQLSEEGDEGAESGREGKAKIRYVSIEGRRPWSMHSFMEFDERKKKFGEFLLTG